MSDRFILMWLNKSQECAIITQRTIQSANGYLFGRCTGKGCCLVIKVATKRMTRVKYKPKKGSKEASYVDADKGE
jgi:hypothetical protein